MTRVGVVTARKDGNRVYYRANSLHPVHGELCWLVLKTDGLAGVLHQSLLDGQITLAFVLGSVARGETHAESDVDLMMIGTIGLRRLTQLLSGVAERLGREFNPHLLTIEAFKERKHKGDRFVTAVLGSPKFFVKGTEHELDTLVA